MTAVRASLDGAQLRQLFQPNSIALVGATDKSSWSQDTFANLRDTGFRGSVYLVNPRSGVVHGQRAHRSFADIGEPVDLAYLMVPTDFVLPVLKEGAALGIRSYVVLTAGFGETGPAGRRQEEEILAFAQQNGLAVLGANGIGYVNATAGITPYSMPIPDPLISGSVGFVLQSGALASFVLNFAQSRNIGVSLLVSVGNETMVSAADVLDYLVDDPATRVVALFLESIRDTERFARAARRAARAGKPVVVLKIGASEMATHAAQAHTGALVGDDAVADAAFRQLGVVRVSSLESLISTAGLLAKLDRIPGPRVGVVTPSGGAAEIIADRAEEEGLELPEYAPETVARLKEIVPAFATVHNPLDVTGYIAVDRTLLSRALDAVVGDPNIDAALVLFELPTAPGTLYADIFDKVVHSMRNAPIPVVLTNTMLMNVDAYGRTVLDEAGVAYAAGIDHAMTALGAAVRWSASLAAGVGEDPEPTGWAEPAVTGDRTGVWVEHRAASLLADNGIPVVPGEAVVTEDEAVKAAARFGYPVVLKAVANGLGHKTDLGGVRLDLDSAKGVRQAFREVTAMLRDNQFTGVGALVQPQRERGVELLVGVVRDPDWGPTMAIGLGGVWVEVLRDSVLLLPPFTADAVRRALGQLRGARLLEGARGTQPADLHRVADVVARIGRLAVSLGPELESLEINPLQVRGTQVEALDALVTWGAG
ncbi:MAG: hypothetical protein QOE94_3116 [Mycobacterium sp.]|nr:hypothetical protein [Mycobacterium sp.]